MSRLQYAIKAVTMQLEAYDLGLANRAVYDFVWSEFCDWYLEAAKPALYEGNARSRYILKTVLIDILKLLHPIIPFVTSEIYEALGFEEQLGMADWPLADESLIDSEAEANFEHLKNAVVGARNLRAEASISPQQSINLYVQGAGAKTLEENARVFESLAKAALLSEAPTGAALNQVVPDLELKLPFEGLIDVNDWKARQEKRLADLRKNLSMSERKLSNSKFVDNAPAAVVDEEKRRMAESQALISGIEQSLKNLK
jgi:valyl-tRNA synthetase